MLKKITYILNQFYLINNDLICKYILHYSFKKLIIICKPYLWWIMILSHLLSDCLIQSLLSMFLFGSKLVEVKLLIFCWNLTTEIMSWIMLIFIYFYRKLKLYFTIMKPIVLMYVALNSALIIVLSNTFIMVIFYNK